MVRREGKKVERIYRILLERNAKKKTWYRIAKDAETAYGWAHRVLSELQDQGLINGSKVIKPEELFIKWASYPTSTRYREYHIQEPRIVFEEVKFDFALTTYYAEQLIGNYLFPRSMDLYIYEKDVGRWHEFLSKRGYVGKGNVRILLADEQVFWNVNKKYSVDIVCTQQLIVDLLREGGVCTEAAELLMERFYGKK